MFRYSGHFLDTPVDVDASQTLVDRTDYNSNVLYFPNNKGSGVFVMEFLRPKNGGSSSRLVVQIFCKTDSSDWFVPADLDVSVPTNAPAVGEKTISGTDYDVVRVGILANLFGINAFKVNEIKNEDQSNNLREVNVYLSI